MSLTSTTFPCKIRDEKSEQSKEDPKIKQEEENIKQKEKWRKKREEYSKRASKFNELRRKRSEEKKRADEAKRVLSSEDVWEELGKKVSNLMKCVMNLQLRCCTPGK